MSILLTDTDRKKLADMKVSVLKSVMKFTEKENEIQELVCNRGWTINVGDSNKIWTIELRDATLILRLEFYLKEKAESERVENVNSSLGLHMYYSDHYIFDEIFAHNYLIEKFIDCADPSEEFHDLLQKELETMFETAKYLAEGKQIIDLTGKMDFIVDRV